MANAFATEPTHVCHNWNNSVIGSEVLTDIFYSSLIHKSWIKFSETIAWAMWSPCVCKAQYLQLSAYAHGAIFPGSWIPLLTGTVFDSTLAHTHDAIQALRAAVSIVVGSKCLQVPTQTPPQQFLPGLIPGAWSFQRCTEVVMPVEVSSNVTQCAPCSHSAVWRVSALHTQFLMVIVWEFVIEFGFLISSEHLYLTFHSQMLWISFFFR